MSQLLAPDRHYLGHDAGQVGAHDSAVDGPVRNLVCDQINNADAEPASGQGRSGEKCEPALNYGEKTRPTRRSVVEGVTGPGLIGRSLGGRRAIRKGWRLYALIHSYALVHFTLLALGDLIEEPPLLRRQAPDPMRADLVQHPIHLCRDRVPA